MAPPSGLSPGEQISLLLDRETLAYSNVKSFDDLPIPFRCVSTDLIAKKAPVFSEFGPIAFAMRSSMSLPVIFDPVRDGDSLYVDGALVDNLPTDLVRDMGPDVVIAIHLQVAPATASDIRSLLPRARPIDHGRYRKHRAAGDGSGRHRRQRRCSEI